jgi:hypothetical protein
MPLGVGLKKNYMTDIQALKKEIEQKNEIIEAQNIAIKELEAKIAAPSSVNVLDQKPDLSNIIEIGGTSYKLLKPQLHLQDKKGILQTVDLSDPATDLKKALKLYPHAFTKL